MKRFVIMAAILISVSSARAEDSDMLFATLIDPKTNEKFIHKQMMTGSQCDGLLLDARRLASNNVPMDVTFTLAERRGIVREIICIRPDGTIRKP